MPARSGYGHFDAAQPAAARCPDSASQGAIWRFHDAHTTNYRRGAGVGCQRSLPAGMLFAESRQVGVPAAALARLGREQPGRTSEPPATVISIVELHAGRADQNRDLHSTSDAQLATLNVQSWTLHVGPLRGIPKYL